MKWEAYGEYAIRSGPFVCSKASVAGKYKYLLWHNGKLISRGYPFDSAADAKRRAVEILGAGNRGGTGAVLDGAGSDRVGAAAGG